MKRTKKKQKQQQQYHQHCFWKTSTITRTRKRDNVENYNPKVQGIRQHSHSKIMRTAIKWINVPDERVKSCNEDYDNDEFEKSPPLMWNTMTLI